MSQKILRDCSQELGVSLALCMILVERPCSQAHILTKAGCYFNKKVVNSQEVLISTGGSTPLLCLEGVPDLPVAP